MSAWPAYIRISRYADRPVALAEAVVYLPPKSPSDPLYIPRVLVLTPGRLLQLWRELRKAGPVRLYLQ